MKFFILILYSIPIYSSAIYAGNADEQPGLAITEDLGRPEKLPISDKKSEWRYVKAVSANYDVKVCVSKCGEVPHWEDEDNNIRPEPQVFVNRVKRYNQCIDECKVDKKHVDKRLKELAVQEPTIESLKKELNACQSQLQLVQEKEPKIYNKLIRDYKSIDDKAEYDRCDVGNRPGCPNKKKFHKPNGSIRDTDAISK